LKSAAPFCFRPDLIVVQENIKKIVIKDPRLKAPAQEIECSRRIQEGRKNEKIQV